MRHLPARPTLVLACLLLASLLWMPATANAAPAPGASPVTVTGCCAPAIPVPPAVILADDRPWDEVWPGYRRKVYQSGRITMVLFEVTSVPRPGATAVPKTTATPATPERPPQATASKTTAPIPLHAHEHDQVTYVLEGKAQVQVGDTRREVGPGSVYVIPSNVPHGLRATAPRFVGLDVFSPVRADFAFGENDVKAFVYRWFSWFDRQVDEDVFLAHLSSEGLLMRFPEADLLNHADFQRWYAGVRAGITSNTHDVRSVTVKRGTDGAFQVDLEVLWKAVARDGSRPQMLVRQQWSVRPDPDGHLRIVKYLVQPVR